MAKRKARPGREQARSRGLLALGLAQEGLGLLLIGLGLLSALAIATYEAADPAFRFAPVANAAGVAGATIARVLVGNFGLGAVIAVLVFLALGIHLVTRGRLRLPSGLFWLAATLLLVSVCTLPALLADLLPGRVPPEAAGALGHELAGLERRLLSGPGALVVNLLVLAVAAPALFGVSPAETLAAIAQGGVVAARQVGGLAAQLGGAAVQGLRGAVLGLRAVGAALARAGGAVQVWRERRARRERVAALREPEAPEPVAAEEEAPVEPTRPAAPRPRGGAGPHIVDHRSERKPEPEQVVFTFTEHTATGPYTPPDIGEIFQVPPETANRFDRDSLIMNSRILEKKLADFGVQGRVVTVHPGPVITMYEFEPAPGVKVNRITNLSDDLALALRALSIRIIAPIPGKSVVGIEVPNPDREVVYIRDLLESKSYRSGASKLTLTLGKDIFGNPFEADLARMPHVLVAGATGTGKSVFLNSLLCSVLCRATPDEVKLLLVDPKLLELSIYEGIPHLIADVVTNPKRAAAALQGIVSKMEERYHQMAALGVRNIAQFNRRVDEALAAGEKTFRLRKKPGEEEGQEVPYQRLPYIIVVIDELADLMVVSARDVEESLQRLAQMARAAGIHLVLATQRPSVDVLTGVIKANFPARISFQVSSKTDSRTILDQGGAEHLLGQGDMLFLPPGTSKLQRLHGSYVSEREVTQLVAYLRTQGTPRFDEDLIRIREESDAREERDEDTDEHYDMAVSIVAESRNASISYIQRRLKVGYNRAARMIEQMEREGVVGPQVGVRPREVYIQPIGADADGE
jgi:S-DNA-T family DNA segregation ATPase FtsK/SpoIIIE